MAKNKQPDKKMSRRQEVAFFQRRHKDGQQTHENMFNITNCQGDQNQNHNEIPPKTCLTSD